MLVVAETAPLLMVLELALTEAGYQVTGTARGGEALRRCQERRFDVAVIDLDLPDMDGFELAAQLRAREEGRNLPMIFMTARREVDAPLWVAAAGGVGLLLKPFPLSELLRIVAGCLPAAASTDPTRHRPPAG
jgi:two-component system OmpR family response regulator